MDKNRAALDVESGSCGRWIEGIPASVLGGLFRPRREPRAFRLGRQNRAALDVKIRELRAVLEGNSARQCLGAWTFNPDGSRALSGSEDKLCDSGDVESERCVHVQRTACGSNRRVWYVSLTALACLPAR